MFDSTGYFAAAACTPDQSAKAQLFLYVAASIFIVVTSVLCWLAYVAKSWPAKLGLILAICLAVIAMFAGTIYLYLALNLDIRC